MIVGGLAGTALRLGIDVAIPHTDDSFPVSTLLINTIGAFTLGLLAARVWPRAPDWLRAGLGAGLLGSFTTFSAVAVSLVSLSRAEEWMLAAGYLVTTMLLGLGAAWLGIRVGSRPPALDRTGDRPIDWVDE